MSRSTIAMRTSTYFVLESMLGGPLHGSAIIERAAALSNGRVRLPAGALYAALDRLMAEAPLASVARGVRIPRVPGVP